MVLPKLPFHKYIGTLIDDKAKKLNYTSTVINIQKTNFQT